MNDRVSPSPQVVVGQIVKPHGVRGEVTIEVNPQFPNVFGVGESVYIQGHPHQINRSSALQKERMVIKFKGISNREVAESLRAENITIPQDKLPTLPYGKYYHFQIIGMSVFETSGEYLGRITEIICTGANDVYVITNNTTELLMPAINQVIKEVDLDRSTMIVQLPKGLR